MSFWLILYLKKDNMENKKTGKKEIQKFSKHLLNHIGDQNKKIYYFKRQLYLTAFNKKNINKVVTQKDGNQFILPLISMNTHSFCNKNFLFLGKGVGKIIDDIIFFDAYKTSIKINKEIKKIGMLMKNFYSVFTFENKKLNNKIVLVSLSDKNLDAYSDFYIGKLSYYITIIEVKK